MRGALVACGLVFAAVGVAACSGDDTATTTTTTSTPTPSTTTSVPGAPTEEQAEQPPDPEWIVQIGGPADDTLRAVIARDDEVVAAGSTASALAGQSAGGTDAFVAVVGTDAEVRSVDQTGTSEGDDAGGVGSGSGTTITCGSTGADLGATQAGGGDAWCAPVDADGLLGPPYQQGGNESDRLDSAAVVEDGTYGYAAGSTLGLFPGASDTSAGVLGGGDAMLWQFGPDGAPRWIRQFGSAASDEATGVAAGTDGDGLVVGVTGGDLDRPTGGGEDGFIARYDRDGLPRWTRQFGGPGNDQPAAVAVGGEAPRGTEAFLAVGSTDGALAPALGGERTDPADGPRLDGGEPAPSNAGGVDAMIASFDSAGEPGWIAQLGTEGDDDARGVAIDGSTVLVAGTTAGAIATTGDPSAGGSDGFLAAFDLETGTLRWITQFGSTGDEDVFGITVTEDGLAVVTGQTTGQLGDQPNAGGSDGFLIAFPLPRAGGSVASAL